MNWYKKAKLTDEVVETLETSGYQLVEEKFFGNYELYLFKAARSLEEILKEYNIPPYQIGFQREDTSFADINQQEQRNPPKGSDIPIKEGMAWLRETISKWLQEYGSLVAMSHSEEKNRVYKATLKRLGFDYTESEFSGYKVIIIK